MRIGIHHLYQHTYIQDKDLHFHSLFLMRKEVYPSPGHHLSVSCQVCDVSLFQEDSFLIMILPVLLGVVYIITHCICYLCRKGQGETKKEMQKGR